MKKQSSLKEFVRYSTLNVLGMIGLSCYILADTFFVANRLGTDGLAALNLAIPVYSFIHGSGLMLGMGGATRYSILKNQKKEKAANTVFVHTLLLAACLALLFCIAGTFGDNLITSALGAKGTIFGMSRTYLKVLLLFSPAFLLNDIMICFIRNDHAPQLSMIAMICGSLSNVVLDYIFLFPLGMGIFGAVLATGLAPVISLLIQSSFFLRRKNQFHMIRCKLKLKVYFQIASSGFPSLITELSGGIVMIIFNMIILRLQGNTGVAAYGVIANLSLVVIAIFTGIAQGVQPLFSRYYGQGKSSRIKEVFYYAMVTAGALSLFIYLGIFHWADGITSMFNSEGNVQLQSIAIVGMRFYFIGCLFAGWNIILSVYFTSLSHTKPAAILSMLRGFLLIIPVTFLLSYMGGTTGLWCAFPVTELLVTALGIRMFVKHSL